jgi:hypothetical protein
MPAIRQTFRLWTARIAQAPHLPPRRPAAICAPATDAAPLANGVEQAVISARPSPPGPGQLVLLAVVAEGLLHAPGAGRKVWLPVPRGKSGGDRFHLDERAVECSAPAQIDVPVRSQGVHRPATGRP